MPERKKLSLTEVLAAFSKEASDTEAATMPADVAAPIDTTPNDPLVSAAKQVVDTANSLKMDQDSAESAAKRVADNTEKLDGAAEALKAIAKEAADNHEASIQKEAQVFGHMFAATVLDEFEKSAQVSAAETSAYSAVMDKIASEDLSEELQKVAEEAYVMCLVKMAYDSGYAAVPQEGEGSQGGMPLNPAMAPAGNAPQGMSPGNPLMPQAGGPEELAEEEAAAQAAAQEEAAAQEAAAQEAAAQEAEAAQAAAANTEALTAATGAVQDAAQAAKSVAQAAQAAVQAATSAPAAPAAVAAPEAEPQEEELAEALPKVAHEAYMATMEYLEKSAEEELQGVLQQITSEAYDTAVQLA